MHILIGLSHDFAAFLLRKPCTSIAESDVILKGRTEYQREDVPSTMNPSLFDNKTDSPKDSYVCASKERALNSGFGPIGVQPSSQSIAH